MVSQANISAFTDVSRFGALRGEAGKNPGNAVGKVAREFEALFIEMMLSSARKAAIKGGMFESHALELYKEMFDTQAARVLSEQGTLGFEQAISRFAGIPDQTAAEQTPLVAHSYAGRPVLDRDTATAKSGQLQHSDGLDIPIRRADLPVLDHKNSPRTLPNIGVNEANSEAPRIPATMPREPVSILQNRGTGATEQYNFMREIAPYAVDAAKKLGTEPGILIAQAALETGWGAHVIPGESGASSNNLFGIKANNRWQGDASQVKTLEFLGGRPISTKASFRRYPDIKSAFDDYVKFVKENPRYANAVGNANSGDRYIRELANAGYATDPKYAEKIISIKDRIEKMNSIAHVPTDPANTPAENSSRPISASSK